MVNVGLFVEWDAMVEYSPAMQPQLLPVSAGVFLELGRILTPASSQSRFITCSQYGTWFQGVVTALSLWVTRHRWAVHKQRCLALSCVLTLCVR